MGNFIHGLVLICMLTQPALGDVIYNRDVEEEFNQITLLQIFTKKQRFWSDGSKIVVFIKPINSIEHKYFVSIWLGVPLSRYKSMLESEVYAGTSTGVNEVKSDSEMYIQVSTTPNSIGYYDGKIYKNTGGGNVKVYSRM